jgi:hypothetical protein
MPSWYIILNFDRENGRKNLKLKIIITVIIALLTCLPALHAESAIDGFAKKVEMADKDIEKSTADLEKLKKDYIQTGIKIEKLKAAKDPGGFIGFISGLELKVYLSKGNRLGFKIYALEKGIAALKEDYFTYVSLITEEYGTQIKDCFDKKCPKLKALCDKRKEWAGAADRYGDVLQIDLSSMKLIKDYSKGAAADVKEYLQKKIIQAEQRIYMLEEEKGVLDIIMKKAGINQGTAEKKKNADKIAVLKKLKKDLQLEIKKIK